MKKLFKKGYKLLFLGACLALSNSSFSQFTEDFEGVGTPAGWSVINQGDANTWTFTTPGIGTANSGSQVARINYDSSTPHDDYLITQQFTVTSGVTDQLRFYAKNRSTSFIEEFNILISTTGNAAVDFTITLAGPIGPPAAWTEYIYDLSAYDGQAIYIAFQAISLDEWELYIDDVTIETPPTCPDPSGLSASNFTTSSADLIWTENGSATSWAFQYGAPGFTPGNGTVVATGTNPGTLGGLSPNMMYDVYVAAVCGVGDSSAWIGPVSIHTFDVSAYTIMEQNTDCPTAGFIDISTTGTAYDLSDDGTQGITVDFPILFQGTLVTEITIDNNGNIEFGTLTGGGGTGGSITSASDGLYPWWDDLDSETGDVYYEVIGTAPNRTLIVQWDNINNYSGTAGDPTVTFQIQIEEATQEIYFVYYDVVFGGAFSGDDFGGAAQIGLAGPLVDFELSDDDTQFLTNNSCARFYYPSCPTPTALSDVYVGIDTIIFNWNAGNTETQWQVEYGTSGFTPGTGTTFVTSDLQDTITGLTQLTTYDIYISAICGVGDSSILVGPLTLTTNPVCPGPTAITVDFVSADSAGISWTNVGGATNWNIQYGPAGFTLGSGIIQATTDNPDTLTGLLPGVVYDVYVQSDCGVPDTSFWEGPVQVFVPIANDTVCGAVSLPVDGVTYFYHNQGATNTGEPGTSPQNTVWFSFVAPASGAVRIGTCGSVFDTELEVFEATACDATMNSLGYADGNPFDVCTGAHPAGIELCGLTSGTTYYFWVGPYSSGNFGQIPVFVEEISVNAGTGSVMSVCEDNTAFDLFSTLTGNQNTSGQWFVNAAMSGNEVTATINVVGASGTYNFFYVDTDACLSDTSSSTIDIIELPNVGVGSIIDAGCNFGAVNLFEGMSGTVDLGGTWYDGANSSALPGATVNYEGEPAGSYDYYYVVDNGVCAADTAFVQVDVIDCTGLEDEDMVVKTYPNPVNDVLYIQFANVDAGTTVQLIGANGQAVSAQMSVVSATTPINMEQYANGLYFLRITNGDSIREIKVIKQ